MDAQPPAHATLQRTDEAVEAATLEQRIRDAEKLYLSFEDAARRLGLILMLPPE